MARKPRELVPLMLRLQEGLRRQLEKAAKTNDRSLNAEINWRLEYLFDQLQREARDTRILNALIGEDARYREIIYEAVIAMSLLRHSKAADQAAVEAAVEAAASSIRKLTDLAIASTDPKKESKGDEGAS
jgi:hypothetical protein